MSHPLRNLLPAAVGSICLYIGISCAEVPEVPPLPEQAEYVGSATCLACHPNLSMDHALTAHANVLTRVQGRSPIFPDEAARAGVPEPPTGFEWFDLSYVLGGYLKGVNFIDDQGYFLTDGTTGVNTQYESALGWMNVAAQFDEYLPEAAEAPPFDYDCFRCHTTGPKTLAESDGQRQNNLPGVDGTWAEDGVQCEACHGPGSRHLLAPSAGNIEVDLDSSDCARCHVDPDQPNVLVARDNFIAGKQQYTEVQFSPHKDFACTVCHDPHVSVAYDKSAAIRNRCQDCHSDVNMAFHEGAVFEWDGYVEEVTCESCHMPPLAVTVRSNVFQINDTAMVRIGDTRSHVMTIDAELDNPFEMFTDDGTQLRINEQGRAFIAPCLVCQRCHHGLGNTFALTPRQGCAIAVGIHETESE